MGQIATVLVSMGVESRSWRIGENGAETVQKWCRNGAEMVPASESDKAKE